MNKNYRIVSAEALSDGHSIRVRWTDGLEGVIDALPWIEAGGVFEALRDPERFKDIRVAEYGHKIYWVSEDGYEIDICLDVLRAKFDPEVAAWIADLGRRYAEEQSAP